MIQTCRFVAWVQRELSGFLCLVEAWAYPIHLIDRYVRASSAHHQGKKPELVDRIYNRLVSTDTGSEAHDEESSATRPKEGLQQPQDRLDGSIPEPSRVASASAATRETPGVSQHTPQSLGADQESTRGKTSATPGNLLCSCLHASLQRYFHTFFRQENCFALIDRIAESSFCGHHRVQM